MAYFMISVDTREDNTAFAEQEGGNFPILADPTKETATAYGVLRDFGGDIGSLPQRWTFYIGGDGRILKIDREVNPSTAGQDQVAALQELNVPRQ